MATTVVPDLIDALVANARIALPSTVEVYDGFGIDDSPGLNYLLVGVDDVDGQGLTFSADARQEWANANGTARDEEGDIVCAAVAWNGDGDQADARTAAFGTVAAVEQMLRSNPSQGVANVLWTSFGSRVQLSQDQNDRGATAIVVFRVHFRARI